MDRKLYIYGTVMNNAKWVEDSINSIMPLHPELIVITDNHSTDGTTEILKNMIAKGYPIMLIEGKNWSRGLGRQKALEVIYKIAKDTDFATYIDLDTIYSEKYINAIKEQMNKFQDNEVGYSMLCTVKTNKLAEWKNLQMGEDWERAAHLVSQGVNIKAILPETNDMCQNRDPDKPWIKRERHYTKSKNRFIHAYCRWT